MTDKTSRWLDLVAFLLNRRSAATREEIFRRVDGYDGEPETGRRKFERDKDELRALGIEIETVPLRDAAGDEPGSGYRLKTWNAYLPYLELVGESSSERPYRDLQQLTLSATELRTLDRATRALMDQRDTPFAAAAASARRKLAFDLPLSNEAVDNILALPIPEHARQALAVLQEAVIEHIAISCRYFTMSRRAEGERELEPWGLLFQWGRWYCVARPRDRDEPRVFRVDRMRNVKRLAGANAKFAVPTDFDVRSFSRQNPWEFGTGDVLKPRVRFAFPEARWVVNRDVGKVVSEEPDRSALIEFEVRDEDAFLKWLLSFGRRAEIEQPVALRDSLAALRADVAAFYAERALVTASDRFTRIVSLVAESTRDERDGGDPPSVRQVSERLGISEKALNEDIRTLTEVSDYADSDWLLSLRISQQADQLSISSAGPFRRPVRLSPEEQLAIQLALAMDPAGTELAARLAQLLAGNGPIPPVNTARDNSIDTVRYAVRERLALEIEYAGEGKHEVTRRTIHPYQVTELGLSTYIVAWADDVQAWRHFRLDRMVSVELTTRHFVPRTDLAPILEPRDSFRPTAPVERVTVKFRPAAAHWVTEFYTDHEVLDDGSVLVRFNASSTDWLVRRVLEFGADAEVIEPARYRDVMRRAIA